MLFNHLNVRCKFVFVLVVCLALNSSANMVLNSGFEDDLNSNGWPDDWLADSAYDEYGGIGGYEYSTDGSQSRTGLAAVSAWAGAYAYWYQSDISAVEGMVYTLKTYARRHLGDPNTGDVKLQIRFRDSDNNYIGTSESICEVPPDESWHLIAASAQAPVETVKMIFIIGVVGDDAWGPPPYFECWFDDVSMVSTEPNSIEVTSPNGGEVFVSGNTERIEWTNTGSYNFVAIDYSTNNGGNWIVLETSTENDGAYDWIIPAVNSEECLVRVKDIFGQAVNDTSDSVFTIFQCQGSYDGDINNDCYVNMKDLVLLAGDWLLCGNPLDSNCSP